jgi:serine/threonine protein kinase
MEKLITDYLVTNLAPQLSIRFNLNLNEVEQEINLICCKTNFILQKQEEHDDVGRLSKLTIPQLKELAIARHIKIPQKSKKNEIIQIIIDQQQNNKKNVHLQKKENIILSDRVVNKKITLTKKNRDFTGQTFTSKSGEQWTIGNLIGSGGFGIIYDVVKNLNNKQFDDPLQVEYVIKLEKNKPGVGLYFETSVYRKLKSDGALKMIDSGKLTRLTTLWKSSEESTVSLEKNEEYYYLILPKFETTLSQKIEQGMSLEEKNNVINDILNRLKFINSKGYVHLDVKPDNIMLFKNEWYLIDFGISYNYIDKEILNKKHAGNGTPLYMSRDMHVGLVSRKADLESLIYVLFKMNNIQLPWVRNQKKKEKKETIMNWILEQKENFMKTYRNLPIPQSHKNFIEKVNAIKINKNNPDYDNLKIKM